MLIVRYRQTLRERKMQRLISAALTDRGLIMMVQAQD